MPEHVFCRFARVREEHGISVSSAAAHLGIGSGFLFQLEEFKKSVFPGYLTVKKEHIASLVYRFLAERDTPSPWPLNENEIWEKLNCDYIFHLLVEPIFYYIFSLEKKKPIRWFIWYFVACCLLGVQKTPEFCEKTLEETIKEANDIINSFSPKGDRIPIFPPANPETAQVIDYLFIRRLLKSTHRRKLSGIPEFVWGYEPTLNFNDSSHPMGYVLVEENSADIFGLGGTVLSIDKGDNYPFFGFSVLYTYVTAYHVSPVPSTGWRVALCLDSPTGPISFFFTWQEGDYTFWAVRGDHVTPLTSGISSE